MKINGHYEVSIVVNGQPLQEYDPPEDEDKGPGRAAGVKYIEAQEGMPFSVRVRCLPGAGWPEQLKSCDIYVDGKPTLSKILSAKQRLLQNFFEAECAGVTYKEDDRYLWRSFMFQKLITTDETCEEKNLKNLARGLGRIKVVLSDFRRDGLENFDIKFDAETKTVPEKALKGQQIDMTAGLGAVQPAPQEAKISVGQRVNPPLATYIFKYRSRAALQWIDLIPTSPEPEALHERDVDTLTLEEARRLLAQYREGERASAEVKKEGAQVKRERSPTPTTKRKRGIDLDDDECQIVEVKRCRTTNRTHGKDGNEVHDLT
ncbi:hypothetical protein LTR05_001945 [Lithohypha guttulata]|uniref:DUF7918 domain-containing protein n=1 Tax=Lithohypha guttulata TaxID=1690604 RepID=A0AAN7T8J5_9EURO|nr:hypothetical protein LTR05_001945 [Lithohypha guttulata]